MNDIALENAKAKRTDLRARIEKIDEEMSQLEDLRERLQREARTAEAFIMIWYEMAGIRPPSSEEPKENESKKKAAPKPKNPDRTDVAARCVEYIREAGRPFMRTELFERLQADGVIIHGKNPEMVLSTMLWRTKNVIRRLKGGGYWPAGDPLPVNYADDFEDLI